MIAPFEIFRGLGGCLLVLLGLYVASLRPRRRENVSFAAFCILSGAGFATALVAPADPGAAASVLVTAGVLFAASASALVRVAVAFPRPLAPGERALAKTAAIVCVLLGVVQVVAYVMRNLLDPAFASTSVRMGALVEDVGLSVFRTAAWFGGLLAALRFANGRDAARADHQALASFTVALALYPAVHGPHHLLDDNAWDAIIGAATSVLLLVVVGVLLRASATTATGSASRWAAWTLLAASAAQMVHIGVMELPLSPNAAAIAAMFAALTYAILRHQLLGIDVKLRFAISKSTLAASFIAVFFIASEAAQQFFGGRLESTYMGIVAAGALVFALAPLQRAAERLAERAVPKGPTPAAADAQDPPARTTRREQAYHGALRIALQDRRLTREEEVQLHRLADELGIPPSRAHQILVEVEREVHG